MNSPYTREDAPGYERRSREVQDEPRERVALEGPDYVALVIEWNEDSDAATIVGVHESRESRESRQSRELGEPGRAPRARRTIAAVGGALAVIALATWGIRHLRAS